jgi:hypothetical protein
MSRRLAIVANMSKATVERDETSTPLPRVNKGRHSSAGEDTREEVL